MTATSPLTVHERIESFKAGSLAALAGGMTMLLCLAGERAIGVGGDLRQGLVRVAIASFITFLFGVTYRYIIRQDANTHLKSGAIGAFALTRGLSQLEAIWDGSLLMASLILGESFGLFVAAQCLLDWAMQQRLLQPFD
jgi:hypothetical protein